MSALDGSYDGFALSGLADLVLKDAAVAGRSFFAYRPFAL